MGVAKVAELKKPAEMPKPTDKQISDFYVRLGVTLAAWQFVEVAIFNIYASVIGAESKDHYNALAASFHTPMSFQIKLNMTDQAIQWACQDASLITEWDKLYKRTHNKNQRRNKIVHSMVMFDPSRQGDNEQLFLSQNIADPKRFDPNFSAGSVISQTELDAALEVFIALQQDLHYFHLRLAPPIRPAQSSP